MTEVESTNISPAVAEAKARRDGKKVKIGEETELSTGVRVKLKRVPQGLIEEVVNRVKDPKVPVYFDPEKEREMPNPSDPDYLNAKAQAERDRSVAAIETIVLFGIELLDGLPEDDDWLTKLKFMARRGLFDIDEYDLDDPLDKEFLYKRYIALSDEDFIMISSTVSGAIDEEEIRKARQSFRDDALRDGDNGSEAG